MGMDRDDRNAMDHIDYTRIPLLAGLDRISLAELVPSFEQVRVKSGALLYRAGDPGDALYVIIEGIVRIFLPPGGKSREIACLGPGEWFGELALLRGGARTTDAEAETDLVLLKLSRARFEELIRKYPSLAVSLAGLLAAKLSKANAVLGGAGQTTAEAAAGPGVPAAEPGVVSRPTETGHPAPARQRLPAALRDRRLLGLVLAVGLCVPSAAFLASAGLRADRIALMELLVAATVMWSLNAFSFHTVSIGLPVVAVLFGITAPPTAFSGFSSSTWFLVLGVFGISAAISKTGLLYRLTLLMLRRFPRNYFGQAFAVAFSGLVLTPVIPSPNGRLVLASPLVLTLTEVLGYRKGSAGAVGLGMASFLGYGNMSFMFMNGSFVCLFMLGLLPPAVASTVTWVSWLKVALPLALVFFVASYLAVVALYRPGEMRELVPSIIEAQLRTLGPLTRDEKVCLVAALTSLAGFVTQSWHHIDGAWVAMLCLLILFGTSVLDQETLRLKVDWPFLISLGALMGFANAISAAGLPEIVAAAAGPYLDFLVGSTLLFLLFITVSVVVIRLVLPAFPSLVVCILALMPISAGLGISPFVIGIIVLLSNEPWLLPHQSMIFQTLMSSTEGRLFDHDQTFRLACVHVLVSCLGVAASIPYWKYLGLIR